MIIKCPECQKEISDLAEKCPNCGCPINENNKKKTDLKMVRRNRNAGMVAVAIGILSLFAGIFGDGGVSLILGGIFFLVFGVNVVTSSGRENVQLIEHKNINNEIQKDPKKEFHGIYRSMLFGGLQEVYCPRCGSEDCSHYQEQDIIPGKTKTRYTANLNPLHPLTLANKKEKVVRKERTITHDRIVCNKCGKIFS